MHLSCHSAGHAASQPRPLTTPVMTPPVEFIRTGTVSPNAEHFVRYVDEDSSGELRLVEQVPLRPARVSQ